MTRHVDPTVHAEGPGSQRNRTGSGTLSDRLPLVAGRAEIRQGKMMARTLPPVTLWLLAALVLLAGMSGVRAADDPPTVAVFPVELADTSGEPPRPDRAGQIAATTAELAQLLAESGRYRPVDLAPIDADLAAAGPLAGCHGCWLAMSRTVGATIAVVTIVHKMSTLISSMEVWMVDVANRRVLRNGAVSLRGDTAEAWHRGIGYLVRNALLSDDRTHPSRASPFPDG